MNMEIEDHSQSSPQIARIFHLLAGDPYLPLTKFCQRHCLDPIQTPTLLAYLCLRTPNCIFFWESFYRSGLQELLRHCEWNYSEATVVSTAPVFFTVRQGIGAPRLGYKGSLYFCSPSFVFPHIGSFPIIHQAFLCGFRVLCASSGLSNDILGT